MSKPLTAFLERASTVLARWEASLPPLPPALDWTRTMAAGFSRSGGLSYLYPLLPYPLPSDLSQRLPQLADLLEIDSQKERLLTNTRAFVRGQAANHALLTGSRGCGKSALVKACVYDLANEGLRLVELGQDDLPELATALHMIAANPSAQGLSFIVYCDDLSFEVGDSSYKRLKVVLDGSLATAESRVRFLLYASSNRRHLLPEFFSDNADYRQGDVGEIHPSEAVEEKIALSDRFGLWLSFYAFAQDHYLTIARHWLRHVGSLGAGEELTAAMRTAALQFALERGSRSGRVAAQFATYWGTLG